MWSSSDSAILIAILNELIPANPDRKIPGAGEIGVADFIAKSAYNDQTLEQNVTFLLRKAQTLPSGVTTAFVRQMQADHPDAFGALLTETYKGYYSRPDMRAKVGVGAHPVHPMGYEVSPESPEIMEELVGPVRARGPVFRDPTGGQT